MSENWILMYLSGNTDSACYIVQKFVCTYTLKWSVDVHDIYTVSFIFFRFERSSIHDRFLASGNGVKILSTELSC